LENISDIVYFMSITSPPGANQKLRCRESIRLEKEGIHSDKGLDADCPS
jgi:hypothetical protein